MRRLPHVTYFSSLADLLLSLQLTDFGAVRSGMRDGYAALVRRSVQVVASALHGLLDEASAA